MNLIAVQPQHSRPPPAHQEMNGDVNNVKMPYYYTICDLEKTTGGNFKCFCCNHFSTLCRDMVVHISETHPQYIHKSKRSYDLAMLGSLRRGIHNWTKEELFDPDPNKKLIFTTAQLERENGSFKCFICAYTSLVGYRMVLHITKKHPKFVHKKNVNEPDQQSPFGNFHPKESIVDPEKKLFYSSSNLQYVGGFFTCICCSYTSQSIASVVTHISSFHPNFVLIRRPVPIKGLDPRCNENHISPDAISNISNQTNNVTETGFNPDSPSYDCSVDEEMMDDDTRCLPSNGHHVVVCPEERPSGFIVAYDHTEFQKNNTSIERPGVIRIEEAVHGKKINDAGKCEQTTSYSKDVLLKELQCANEYLITSREFWKTKYANEVVKLREGSNNNEMEMNQMVIVKDELDNRISKSYCNEKVDSSQMNPLEYECGVKVSKLEKFLEDKDAQIEEMKKRIEELENNNCKSKIEEIRKEFANDDVVFHGTEDESDDLSDILNVECLLPGYDALMDIGMGAQESKSNNLNRRHGMNKYDLVENNESIDLSNGVSIDFPVTKDLNRGTETDRRSLHDPMEDKSDLIRKLRAENEHLRVSMDSLKQEMEMARLKGELDKKSEVDPNQMLTPKEEMEREFDDFYTKIGGCGGSALLDDKSKNLEQVIVTKDKEIKKLNKKSAERVAKLAKQLQLEREKMTNMEKELISTKILSQQLQTKYGALQIQLKCESEKASGREEELAKKVFDAELKLLNYTRKAELREKTEKLQLEKERAKRAKEAHIREMEKFVSELVFID